MTAFEDRTAATAVRQINKYGKTVTIQSAGVKTYDPATSKYTGTDPAAFTVKGLVTDFNSRVSRIGLDVRSGDKMLMLAAKGLDKPTISDKFTVDDDTFTVVPVHEGGLEVTTVYAGEIPVLYKVHGRKT